MNKFSGYREFTLASGRKLELKYCNGATEIFAELMGITDLRQIDTVLSAEHVEGKDEEGNVIPVPLVTPTYLKALRLSVYAAAKYAALVQNKPIDFNEWDPIEWIEGIGTAAILKGYDVPDDAAKKNETQPEVETQPTAIAPVP